MCKCNGLYSEIVEKSHAQLFKQQCVHILYMQLLHFTYCCSNCTCRTSDLQLVISKCSNSNIACNLGMQICVFILLKIWPQMYQQMIFKTE